jgi:hypothetical protein
MTASQLPLALAQRQYSRSSLLNAISMRRSPAVVPGNLLGEAAPALANVADGARVGVPGAGRPRP